MSTTESTYTTHLDGCLPYLNGRLSLQPECHESRVHIEAFGRGKAPSFNGSTARFRCAVEAS
jgi:hypothetical protein